MNKMLKLALGTAMAFSLALPAMAQENFPDVPGNHWAYEALKNLKDKVLFGYPDGLYRGNRPMSRYEFAVAINQLHQLLAGRVSALEGQVKSLEDMIKNMPKGGDTGGLQSLRDQLSALTKRVDGLEAGQADLKKLVAEFEKELAGLGVDVDAMKKDIADLDSRVTTLEKIKPTVSISGDVNFLVLGGYSTDGNFGLSQSGESLGRGRVAPFGKVGADKDLSVLHEAGITLSSTNETGPKFKGTFVLGNMLDTFGSLRGGTPGGTFAEQTSDIAVYELYATFDNSVFGQGFSAVVGRFGHKNQEYILNRADRTTYYKSDRYDNGKYIIDGAALTFALFGSKTNLYGGKLQATSFNSNTMLSPIAFRLASGGGTAVAHRVLGVDSGLKAGPVDLSVAAQYLDSDTPGTGFNKLFVYGGEASTKVAGLGVKAAFAESVFQQGNKTVKTTGTNTYKGEVSYDGGRLNLVGGYRSVGAFFAGPGAWGRIGTQFSPTGIEGFYGKADYDLSDSLNLYAKAMFYSGLPHGGTRGNLALGKDDDVQSLTFGATYKLSDAFGIDASYEDVQWRLNNANDPYQRWFTLGFNWGMSEQANMRLFWQYSDADDKGTNVFTNSYGLGANRFKGGVIGTQLSVKF
jgi:uncharacterized protein (UPF0335 family)